MAVKHRYIGYIIANKPAMYRLARSLGHQDDDIDQECALYVLNLKAKGVLPSLYVVAHTVLRSLIRRSWGAVPSVDQTCRLDADHLNDVLETLPAKYKEVVRKNLHGEHLGQYDRRLLRQAEYLVKERLYRDR